MNDRTWELIEKHLESGAYDVSSAQDSAPAKEVLLAFGREVGCTLPDEFIAHSCGRYGGLYVAVKEEIWPRPKQFDVGPFWSFLYGMYSLNLVEGIPEFMDLRTATEALTKQSGQPLVPCLKLIGDADRYCIDQQGRIVIWDHETNVVSYRDASFFEILDYELGNLRERKDKKLLGHSE